MNTEHLLEKNGLSITSGRKEILNLLLNSSVALSEKEIREKLDRAVDRATVYRTLKTFTRKDITHPVITEKNTTKYVIKKDSGEHMHFKCTHCDQVVCFPEIRVSSYRLPEGYIKDEVNFLVTGVCKRCNQQTR